MPTVLIGGGSGLVGTRLSEMLKDRGYSVIHLSRKPNLDAAFPAYGWDFHARYIDPEALVQADYIVNLAGAGIADRPWTEARKQLIIDSRVETNRLLIEECTALNHRPRAFISGAAIGYYGNRGDELVDETSDPGSGFLSESCVAWENSIDEMRQTGVRTVAIRIGLVLSPKGGALEKMLIPVRLGVSGYFGTGKQWYSWVHLDDLCNMFIYALENVALKGTYNGVAPNPERNKVFAQALAKAAPRKQMVLPVPAIALRMAMGEMADTVLYSTRVSSAKIEETGFEFQFPHLLDALQDLLG